MINIHDKLWYIVNTKEEETTLAYMTYYKEDKAFLSRKATGISWAEKSYLVADEVKELKKGTITDNTPIEGFYIGESISRWSTSNKVFRVIDPRGFTVEVPSGNISTLLHQTTVINGVIQGECVWGREGSNHILLPKGSEPYEQALSDKDTLENKTIRVSELKEGDIVLTFGSDQEYTYLGKFKRTWEVEDIVYNSKEVLSVQEATDSKFVTLFAYCYSGRRYYAQESLSKIIKVIGNQIVNMDNIQHDLPERVSNKLEFKGDRWYAESKVISFIKK